MGVNNDGTIEIKTFYSPDALSKIQNIIKAPDANTIYYKYSSRSNGQNHSNTLTQMSKSETNIANSEGNSITQNNIKSQDMHAIGAVGGGAGVDSWSDEQTPYGTMAGVGAAIAMGGKKGIGGFFSKLEQTVQDKLPAKFGESALKGVLKNNGVKEDDNDAIGEKAVISFFESADISTALHEVAH